MTTPSKIKLSAEVVIEREVQPTPEEWMLDNLIRNRLQSYLDEKIAELEKAANEVLSKERGG